MKIKVDVDQLLARAEREGLDLRAFATGDDTDDGW